MNPALSPLVANMSQLILFLASGPGALNASFAALITQTASVSLNAYVPCWEFKFMNTLSHSIIDWFFTTTLPLESCLKFLQCKYDTCSLLSFDIYTKSDILAEQPLYTSLFVIAKVFAFKVPVTFRTALLLSLTSTFVKSRLPWLSSTVYVPSNIKLFMLDGISTFP